MGHHAKMLVDALADHSVPASVDDVGDVVASWGRGSARVALRASWWCLMETTEWPDGAHLYPRGMEEVTAVYVARRLKGEWVTEVTIWQEALAAAPPRRREPLRPRRTDRHPLPRRDRKTRHWPLPIRKEQA